MSGRRVIHAPHGSECTCKGWHQEAAMRMLMNNLASDDFRQNVSTITDKSYRERFAIFARLIDQSKRFIQG